MKLRLPLFLLSLFILVAAACVRDVYAQGQPGACPQPLSYKFDEFAFTNADDAAGRLKKFEDAVNESKQAKGYVRVYGGKKSRVNEIREIMTEIRKALKLGDAFFNGKFAVAAYGYGATQTVQLFIKPLECSRQLPYERGIEIEEVEFAEAPADATLKKSPEEIAASLVKKTETVCPPAASMVRACNSRVKVYVVIDRNGDVIFASGVSGHPLLQQAATATVRNWKFRPAQIDDKTYNVAGHVFVEFRQQK